MGYYPQESLYKPYKNHGYTVRGTPNCPLITSKRVKSSFYLNKEPPPCTTKAAGSIDRNRIISRPECIM